MKDKMKEGRKEGKKIDTKKKNSLFIGVSIIIVTLMSFLLPQDLLSLESQRLKEAKDFGVQSDEVLNKTENLLQEATSAYEVIY
jgi:hypothetical protein